MTLDKSGLETQYAFSSGDKYSPTTLQNFSFQVKVECLSYNIHCLKLGLTWGCRGPCWAGDQIR